MIDDVSPLRVPQSERTLSLFAVCIQVAVRLRFEQELPLSTALELARVHDLRSALRGIAAKLELHRNVSDAKAKAGLAFAEAALTSDEAAGAAAAEAATIAAVIAVRKGATEAMSAHKFSADQRTALLATLREVREDSRRWANGYSRFSTALLDLYKAMRSELTKMPLASSDRARALAELEEIIRDATIRAGGA
jgi:hypothetical protein